MATDPKKAKTVYSVFIIWNKLWNDLILYGSVMKLLLKLAAVMQIAYKLDLRFCSG